MKMKKMVTAACLMGVVASVQATDYYVSPDGSGQNYTQASPGKLTSTVIGKLKAGDVLYLMDGQFDLNNTLSINRNGTADNMITICAAPGAKPVIDFRNENNGTNGIKVGGNYLHFKDIVIRYAGYKGIWLEEATYCILEHMEIYGCCNAGFQLRSGGHNQVINCDAHDNFDYQDDGGNADGFADKQGNACPGNIYIGCRSWNNSDDGWDSFQRVTSGTPTVYVNCIAYNNGPATFDLTSHPRVLGKDAGLSCFSGKDLANYANGGNPNGFKVGGKGTQHDVELYRCLAAGHRSKGFDQNNNAGNMKVINCTSYKNKYNYGFGNPYSYTLVIKNCVSLAKGSSDFDKYSGATSIVNDHNTWNTGFSCTVDDFEGVDIESIIFAERNSDGSLAETTQFHLKSSATNLIDKGEAYSDFSGEKIADYVYYNGTAPDLGCYESGESSGIEAMTLDEGTISPNAPCYNLQGRRVDSSYKGVVVQYGHKFLAK